METSIFVTDLAQQFSLSVVGLIHPVVVPRWPKQAGAGFSDHIVPAAIAFDCEARYARVMYPTGNNQKIVTKPSYVLDTEQRSAHHFRQWPCLRRGARWFK